MKSISQVFWGVGLVFWELKKYWSGHVIYHLKVFEPLKFWQRNLLLYAQDTTFLKLVNILILCVPTREDTIAISTLPLYLHFYSFVCVLQVPRQQLYKWSDQGMALRSELLTPVVPQLQQDPNLGYRLGVLSWTRRAVRASSFQYCITYLTIS